MEELPAFWRGALAAAPAQDTAPVKTALERVNRRVAGHGLTLTPGEIQALSQRRVELLCGTGRIEFGEGVLPKLAFAFCDSPHIAPGEWAATLEALLECFYHFKNETLEAVGDDDLLDTMKRHFDGDCQGSVELLAGTLLERLARGVRFGSLADEDDAEEAEDEEDADDQ